MQRGSPTNRNRSPGPRATLRLDGPNNQRSTRGQRYDHRLSQRDAYTTDSVLEHPATGVPPAWYNIVNTQLVVKEFEDGDLTMYPAIAMTSGEARHYANPNAVAKLDQALASAKSSDTQSHKLKSQHD